MAVGLNPYLGFADNAREAMEFYQGVFGGELQVSTFGEYGAGDAPGADLVMHANLQTPSGFTLMAADTPPGMSHSTGSSISISLAGDAGSSAELRGYFTALAEGGTVTMPLDKQVWGDEFGMCTDRFGITWMVNIGHAEA